MGFTHEGATGLISIYSQQTSYFHSAADKVSSIICPLTQSSHIVYGFAAHARCVSFAALYQATRVPEKPQQCLPAIVHQEGPAERSRPWVCNFAPSALGCVIFKRSE